MDGSARGEFIPVIRLIIGGGERKYALVSVLRMEPCTYTRAGGVHVYNSPRKHVTLGTRNDTVYTNGSMGGTCYRTHHDVYRFHVCEPYNEPHLT